MYCQMCVCVCCWNGAVPFTRGVSPIQSMNVMLVTRSLRSLSNFSSAQASWFKAFSWWEVKLKLLAFTGSSMGAVRNQSGEKWIKLLVHLIVDVWQTHAILCTVQKKEQTLSKECLFTPNCPAYRHSSASPAQQLAAHYTSWKYWAIHVFPTLNKNKETVKNYA